MGLTCEKCGRPTQDRTDRFCRPHAVRLLRQMKREGYLVPLSYRTPEGVVRLADRGQTHLTLEEDRLVDQLTSLSKVCCGDS